MKTFSNLKQHSHRNLRPTVRAQFQTNKHASFKDTSYSPISQLDATRLLETLQEVKLLGGEERVLLAKVSSQVEELNANLISIHNLFSKTHSFTSRQKIVPIETLTNKYRLITPIYAVVEYDEDSYVAAHYESEVFGEGETEFGALADLKASIADYFDDLREDPTSLGPLPSRHYQYLSTLIKEVR